MKIAIIGSGISGLTCAYLLHKDHDITVFEANDYIGGHTHTVDVEVSGDRQAVDTGFIVFNERNYPNFVRLMRHLKVESKPTTMSFSVRVDENGLEYNGTSINSLFAQRTNFFKPTFVKMVLEILRFQNEAKAFVAEFTPEKAALTLGEFAQQKGYSKSLIDWYLIPITASIWSSNPKIALTSPAIFILSFLNNHGMLDVSDRPVWRVIQGGSREYVKVLTKDFRDRILTSTPVSGVKRDEKDGKVYVRSNRSEDRFDQVILACHSDQALRMLVDPSSQEKEILTAMAFQPNQTTLHVDESILPRKRLARAAWNYHVLPQSVDRVQVTYWMNELQGLTSKHQYSVTLNRDQDLAKSKILFQTEYDHPIFSTASVAAQKRHAEISGVRNTHYCGAYWGFGFHEDGVTSALHVCQAFGKALPG